ncbi:ABC transporter permease [Clostridium sp. B9]|uniref:ABC transporter permease n=1 Tax=Clostridium sp. B9 TaxID=3423224 RepID=UPI003D2E9DB6
MMNLIKSEVFKLKREKNLYIVLLLIVILFSVISNFTYENVVIGLKNILGTNRVNLNSGSYIMVEMLKSADILILLFLPIISSILMIDFSSGTIKNNIISGYSRSKIYLSKLIVCSITCILIVLFYVVIAFCMVTIKNGYDGSLDLNLILETIKVILIQIPIYIGIISTAFMIGILTQNKTVVISIYLLYQFVIEIIFIAFGDKLSNIMQYEPISNLDKVAHISTNTSGDNLTFILIGIVMIVVTIFIGLIKMNRMDIK